MHTEGFRKVFICHLQCFNLITHFVRSQRIVDDGWTGVTPIAPYSSENLDILWAKKICLRLFDRKPAYRTGSRASEIGGRKIVILPLASMNFFERVIHTCRFKIRCFPINPFLNSAFDLSSLLLTLPIET